MANSSYYETCPLDDHGSCIHQLGMDVGLDDSLQALVGGAMASWLVRSTPERVVRVRVLAGDIVLCSWARPFTLTVPLSTQVYKWVLANLMLGVTLQWTTIPSSRFMLQKPG